MYHVSCAGAQGHYACEGTWPPTYTHICIYRHKDHTHTYVHTYPILRARKHQATHIYTQIHTHTLCTYVHLITDRLVAELSGKAMADPPGPCAGRGCPPRPRPPKPSASALCCIALRMMFVAVVLRGRGSRKVASNLRGNIKISN